MAEISPFRRPHDRAHDGPQSVASDATIVPQRHIEVQPIFFVRSPDRLNLEG